MDQDNIDMSFTTMQERALGINGTFIGITIIVMSIRMYARLALQKSVGWDDHLMLVGALTTIGLSINTIVAVHLGVGRLISQIPLPWNSMLLAIFCTRIFYCFGILFVKLSLLVLYLRLDPRQVMRWIVYFVGANVMANSIAGVIVSIIGCIPPELFWHAMEDPVAFQEHCLPPDSLQIFWDTCGAHVILTDVVIWAMPIPMIWQLQLPLRLKLAVSSIFALGIFSVAASCVRFYYVRRLSGETEQYYVLADSLNWCALELHVAIFCGSSSALKAFLKRHFPAVLGSSDFSNKGASGPSDGHPLSHLSASGGIHHVTVSSKPQSKGYAVMDDPAENGSEEAIIPESRGITVKREIRQEATSDPRSSEDRISR